MGTSVTGILHQLVEKPGFADGTIEEGFSGVRRVPPTFVFRLPPEKNTCVASAGCVYRRCRPRAGLGAIRALFQIS